VGSRSIAGIKKSRYTADMNSIKILIHKEEGPMKVTTENLGTILRSVGGTLLFLAMCTLIVLVSNG
jgi:hypothetical protein